MLPEGDAKGYYMFWLVRRTGRSFGGDSFRRFHCATQ
jgi:hypothetical protein